MLKAQGHELGENELLLVQKYFMRLDCIAATMLSGFGWGDLCLCSKNTNLTFSRHET